MQRKVVDATLDWPTEIRERIYAVFGIGKLLPEVCEGILRYCPTNDGYTMARKRHMGKIANSTFASVKRASTAHPVLAHRSKDKIFVGSTDGSKYAVGATLEQEGRPVAFLSHWLSKAESNWDTRDQELLEFTIDL